MVRKRAAGREPQGREPCGRKAKGKSTARREEKEAGESETEPDLGVDAHAQGGQETRCGGGGGADFWR